MATLIPKFKQSGTGAVNRDISLKLAETVSVKDFGAVGNGVADDTAAIQAAHNASYRVYYPNGTYNVTGNITIRTGTYIEGSGAGQTLISLSAAMVGAEDAVYKLLVTDFVNQQGGLTVSNIFINGQNRFGHGFFLQNVRFPVFENVWIFNFDGSAIVYDYCEEGYADFLNINGCGRTSGDPNVTANTTYGQITFAKTASALGNNNFLRFNDCTVANGRCSGDFFVKTEFASRIYIENTQSEVSGASVGNRDWLAANGRGAIFFVNGCDIDGYRTVFANAEYVELYASNIRCAASTNFLTAANGTASAKISNCIGSNITTTSVGGYLIENSVFTNLTFNFIAGKNIVNGVVATSLTIADVGAAANLIVCDSNFSGNFTSTLNVAIPIRASNVIIGGNLSISSNSGIFVDTVTTGTAYVSPDNYYQPTQYRTIQILSGTAAPTTGYYKVGSIVYNTAPTAGGTIGFVCTAEGSPGTWKTFGAISA